MSLPGARGLRAAGGLRAAWERQQQAAQLATAVRRIPQLATSKPAFLAAQLGPVVAALRQAGADADAQAAAEGEEAAEAAEAGRHLALAAALPAAAAHLRRLQGIDAHAGANASLLLWLLLERAAEGGGDLLAGPLLLPLVGALGWQELLLGALPLLPSAQRQRLEAGLVATATAAAADGSAVASQRTAVQQLVAGLASSTQKHLEQYHSGASGDAAAAPGELLAGMALLQRLLLVCPVAAAGGALQGLQAAADACMAGLMQAIQQQQQQQQQQQEQGAEARQAVFQQLCQLRARLMLAGAAAGSTDSAAAPALVGASASGAVRLASCVDVGGAQLQAGERAWAAVLHMPPDVAATAGRAACGTSATRVGLHVFLAARLAASCYLQGINGGSSSSSIDGAGSAPHGAPPGLQTCVPALPGVQLQLLALPGQGARHVEAAGSSSSADASLLAAAAEEAAAELARDPASLGPVQRALAALQLAELASGGPEGGVGTSCASTCLMLLLELTAAAAFSVGDPRHQRQLLLLALHGRHGWQRRLRRRLEAHAELQRRTRSALVAVANRVASDAGQAGSAVVHGDERRRRTAAAVAALLPHALLCPGAVLERLVREALVQQGSQVELLLDLLREMRPLALLTEQEGGSEAVRGPPLLLALLAQQLGGSDAAALGTPGSRDACVQLVGGLCGAAGQRAQAAAGAAGAAAGAVTGTEEPLLSRADVLQHAVAPALEQCARQQAVAPERLQLLLRLTQVLLQGGGGGGATSEAAAAQRQRVSALLQPLLGGLLDLDRRRVDRSAAALTAGAETLELAASTLQQLGGQSLGADAACNAAAYFQQQLQALQAVGAAAPPRQQLLRLRRGMLQLLAALLPCCTAGEGREVLGAALPAAIQAALMPPASTQQPGGSSSSAILPGAHAAAVEAACRAALALALHPEQAPLATEEGTPSSKERTASSDAAGGAAPPPPLRRAAVERTLQHLTQHCARLVAAATDRAAWRAGAARRPAAAGAVAEEEEEGFFLRLGVAEAQALGLRCFRELCQLAAAVQPAGYDCGTLQAGLLRLAQLLKAPPNAARAGDEVVQQEPQQQLALRQVSEQLAAAAGALPAGALRDVVLLAASGGST